MRRIIASVILLIISLFLFSAKKSLATGNFSVSYDIKYTVLETGLTHAVFDVSLTNTNSKFYATSYTLNTGFKEINDISAYNSDGTLKTELVKKNASQSIKIIFDKAVAGVNKTQKFTAAFDTLEIVKKRGQIWEITIPPISYQEGLQNYFVTIDYPQSFGKPLYTKPKISSKSSSNNLEFSGTLLKSSGISIVFGQDQEYDLSLSYALENNNLFPVLKEIAIPPSTNYQDVTVESINPKPTNVVIDQDGNWLAQYKLKPSEKLDINVKVSAKVGLLSPKKEELSEEDRQLYLSNDKFWDVSDDKITTTSKKLKTPKAIYDYVINLLSHDSSRVNQNKPRLGAKKVIDNPKSAVCLEFTDLFIALARSSAIPAREINGFAYSENQEFQPLSLVEDVLHSWPEYYDDNRKTWIMVDPTWGKTTGGQDYFEILDLNHITFVRKGKQSTYPIAAGGYSNDGDNPKKDVLVTFGGSKKSDSERVVIDARIPYTAFPLFPLSIPITVTNNGSKILSNKEIKVESKTLKPSSSSVVFKKIPPYGTVTSNVNFTDLPILTSGSSDITILTDGKTYRYTLKSSLFPPKLIIFIIGGVIVGIFSIFLSKTAFKARRLSIFR